jgi:hypothetical protein
MEGSCEYIEEAVASRQEEVVLREKLNTVIAKTCYWTLC